MIRIKVAKDKNYSVINNEFIFNKQLSLKAKGLLCHLLAVPEDWRLYVSELCKWHKDGKKAVYSGFKELIAYGYVTRKQIRRKGKIESWEYTVYEKPLTQNVEVEKEEVEKQQIEKEPLLSNNKTNNLIKLNTKEGYNEFLESLEVNIEAWEYWKKYRKETFNSTYKPLGEKAALKKMARLSDGNKELQLKIIEQSIENGWRGLFKLKETERSKISNTLNNWQAAREIIENG